MHFCVDFGHCLRGADTGASGNGKREENCTREIGNSLVNYLRSGGHKVTVISIDSANSVQESLRRRQEIINSSGCDLAISIHLNAGGGRGVEIWVDGYSNSIADKTLSRLASLGYYNRGLKTGELAVVNYVNPKAMLVECGFIDSAEDMNRYNANNIARAIFEGVTGQSTTVSNDVKIGLDEPRNAILTDTDTLNVRGWVLGKWNTVEIFVDGNNFGGVELNQNREDVYNAYPSYGNHNAGFKKTIKFSGIDNGVHECRLKVCDSLGKFHEIAQKFTVKKELRIALDEPNKNSNSKIKGWALSGKGIKSIECFVNDEKIGDYKINATREDVAKAYPYYYNGANCGFEYSFDSSKYSAGEHNFKLKVTSNDGEVREIGVTFKGTKVATEENKECEKCEKLENENKKLNDKLNEIKKIVEV